MARRIGIGEALRGGPDGQMRVTLGSCVGLCLASTREPKFALAHVLLPSMDSSVESSKFPPSRFASTVVPYLLEMLEIEGRERRTLRAFIAGGASMFSGGSQRSQVGTDNAARLQEELVANRVSISASDLGGINGRQLVVDAQRGRVFTVCFDAEDSACDWELPHVFRSSAMGDSEETR